jgi:hypothetical protein
MQTRHKSNTQQTPPRTAEVQQQITDDAKFAKRISMLPRSPTKKESNGKPRSQKRKPSITIRRFAFGRGAGLKGPLRKDEKEGQVQAGGDYGVAAVEHSQEHGAASSPSGDDHEEEETEADDLAILAEKTRMANKKLRSLFKDMRKNKENQLAFWAEELKQEPRDICEPVGEARANIAQTIPAHLRQVFSASVVNSIRAQRGQGDGICSKEAVEGVMGTMRDLLRKPPVSTTKRTCVNNSGF